MMNDSFVVYICRQVALRVLTVLKNLPPDCAWREGVKPSVGSKLE